MFKLFFSCFRVKASSLDFFLFSFRHFSDLLTSSLWLKISSFCFLKDCFMLQFSSSFSNNSLKEFFKLVSKWFISESATSFVCFSSSLRSLTLCSSMSVLAKIKPFSVSSFCALPGKVCPWSRVEEVLKVFLICLWLL